MGMPAARMTDNHVCPMVTGVVPHVGGPVMLFCPTVMICSMLASRATDMAVCVGPPDLVAMGSTTTLIGTTAPDQFVMRLQAGNPSNIEFSDNGGTTFQADGKPVHRLSDLTDQIEQVGAGKSIRISLKRGSQTRDINIDIVDVGRS